MSCPACGGEKYGDQYISVEKDYSIAGFVYRKCKICSTVYLFDSRITSQEQLTKMHADYWYERNFEFSPEKSIEERINSAEQSAVSILDACGNKKNISRILDIGCGNGELVAAFVKLSFDAYGFEPNKKAFAARGVMPSLNRRLFNCSIEGLYQHEDNITELNSVFAEQFDLVVLNDVLEHLFDPARALKSILSLLRTGGFLYIQVPSGESLQIRYLKEFAWNFMAPFHRTLFSRGG